VKCPRCQGRGRLESHGSTGEHRIIQTLCPRCLGAGEVPEVPTPAAGQWEGIEGLPIPELWIRYLFLHPPESGNAAIVVNGGLSPFGGGESWGLDTRHHGLMQLMPSTVIKHTDMPKYFTHFARINLPGTTEGGGA